MLSLAKTIHESFQFLGHLFSEAIVGSLDFPLDLGEGEVLRVGGFLLSLVFFDEELVGLILCIVKVG